MDGRCLQALVCYESETVPSWISHIYCRLHARHLPAYGPREDGEHLNAALEESRVIVAAYAEGLPPLSACFPPTHTDLKKWDTFFTA